MSRATLKWAYAAVVLAAVLMLTAQATSVHRLRHDDAISYLAATGHQGAFSASKKELANRWVEADRWQAHWQPDHAWRFGKIGRDLAEKDIHPPLYFWLLHIWVTLVGVSLTAGSLLNTPFHLLACLAITRSCRALDCPRWAAAFAGALWLLSGANLVVAEQARPYSLLGAISSMLLLATLKHLKEPTPKSAFGLFVLIVAGILTHYHFALLLAVLLALVVIGARLTGPFRAWRTIGVSTAIALVLAIVMHPRFYLSFHRQASQNPSFVLAEVPSRAGRLIRALLEQFMQKQMAQDLVLSLPRLWLPISILAAACALLGIAMMRRRDWKRPLTQVGQVEATPLALGLGCLALIGALYVSCRSPAHAMDAKYLMLVTPALYVAVGQAMTALHKGYPRVAVTAVTALLMSQAAYGLATTTEAVAAARESQKTSIPRDVPLVLDSTRRGVLPGVVWHVAPTTPVFAAPQEVLSRGGLPADLPGDEVLYVSDPRYGNKAEATEAVLRAFAARGYAVKQAFTTDLWPGKTFLLKRSSATP